MTKENNGILTASASDSQIVVTADSPLIINQVSVTYDDVDIQGGFIRAEVTTTTTFTKLTKTS